MNVQILQVPYDSGHRGARMGGGPEHFVRNGIVDALQRDGHEAVLDSIEAVSSFRAEIRTAFELYRQLADRVRVAVDRGAFPLVLSGNCNSCLGTVAGVGAHDLGVIWFDAHGDFNTPETTESGFLDGMALATAAGLCWTTMTASIPHFEPVRGEHLLHVGSRDFYPREQALFEDAGGTLVEAARIRESGVTAALSEALDRLRSRVSRIYLHFDLDVLDPAIGPANEFAEPDGLMVEQIAEAVRLIGERFTIAAAGIASYDPRFDPQDEVRTAGMAIVRMILAAAGH